MRHGTDVPLNLQHLGRGQHLVPPGITVEGDNRAVAQHAFDVTFDAIDSGVNFVDTADVYGDGRSEQLVAKLRKARPTDKIYVATKAGRQLPAQTREGYSRENLTKWVDAQAGNRAYSVT